MKRKLNSLALATMLILTGCNNAEVPAPEGKINISTGIEAISRAPQLDENGAGSFTAGDRFNLLAFNSSRQYTVFDYTIGSTDLYWKDLNVASDNGRINFAACYPVQDMDEGTFMLNLETAPEKDLLLAYAENVETGTKQPVMLSFKHAMHRIVINYTVDSSFQSAKPDEILTGCSALSVCTVSLFDKTISADHSARATFAAMGKAVSFLIVPQNAADVTLHITAGEDTNTCSLEKLMGKDVKLESGKQLELNLLVKEGKIILEEFSIEGWENQGSIDGDIIM